MVSHELKNLSPASGEIDGPAECRDEMNLARLGKKAVLKVCRSDIDGLRTQLIYFPA